MRLLGCLCCLLLFRPALAAPATPEKETPAEKLRKALDQVKEFDIAPQPLARFADVLSEQTGIRFVVDPALRPSVPGLGMLPVSMAGGAGIRGVPPPKEKPKRKGAGAPGKSVRFGTADLLLTALAPAPQPAKPTSTSPRYRLPPELQRTQAVLAVLQKKFDKVDDPSFTLGQMLNALSTKFSRPGDAPPFFLTFDVNERAFKAEKIELDKLLSTAIAEKPIPAVINVSLANYLRRILDRCPGDMVFILRTNAVEITTRKAMLTEFYHDRPKKDLASLPPLVNIAFDRRPLDEALEKLAGATEGFNVALNGSLREAKFPVSATFRNVPLDTAVWTLADMAGLDVVRKDNLLYVTRKKLAQPGPSAPAKPTPTKLR